jgi:hypothetical protein
VAQLGEKEQDLVKWRKERDSLVTALEVQLTKLLSNIADKDEQIASLRSNATSQPAEVSSSTHMMGLLGWLGAVGECSHLGWYILALLRLAAGLLLIFHLNFAYRRSYLEFALFRKPFIFI